MNFSKEEIEKMNFFGSLLDMRMKELIESYTNNDISYNDVMMGTEMICKEVEERTNMKVLIDLKPITNSPTNKLGMRFNIQFQRRDIK